MDINSRDTRRLNSVESNEKQKNMKKKIFPFLVLIIILASLSTAGYFYWQLDNFKKNPNAVTENENRKLVEDIGRIILLPKDEDPTVATVTDPSKLSDQVFFANAKVGYKVLVYSLAKKAIMYDPISKRIIEVGPISTEDKTSSDNGTIPE